MSDRAYTNAQALQKTSIRSSPTSGLLQRTCACGQHTLAGGECESCHQKRLQRATTSVALVHNAVPPIVHDVLRSPGQPLDTATCAFMEPHFGHDFSGVRVHTDAKAAESTRSVNALAYTVGRDVVFGTNQYAPHSHTGQKLLAHELTHVVQQKTGTSHPDRAQAISQPGDSLEMEADRIASRVVDRKPLAESAERSMAHPALETLGSRARVNPTSLSNKAFASPLPQMAAVGQRIRISGRMPSTLLQRQPIPVAGSPVPLAGPYTGTTPFPAPPPAPPQSTNLLVKEMQTLIDGATWKEIRKRVYPKESAAGIKRAKDRKAGKLPNLTGLGRIKTLEHFAKAVRSIQAKWASLSSPDNRVKELGKAANVELKAAEVPEFLTVDKEPMEFKGFFSPSEWKFVISEALVNSGSLSNDDAAEVSNTTLHESRHAEQNFLAARFSAGMNKKDAAAIATEQGIPQVIADKAVAKKMDAKTDSAVAALGKQMYQANVTDSAKNQAISDDDGLKELAKIRKEAQIALGNLQANNTAQTVADATAKRDALRAQITVVEQKYTLYRNIPYEADAHEVGDAAEQAFRGWP